jgi:SMC interacting uncharacterized protein involved in chromosome segregation
MDSDILTFFIPVIGIIFLLGLAILAPRNWPKIISTIAWTLALIGLAYFALMWIIAYSALSEFG